MIVVFGSINVDLVTRVAAIPQPGETVLGPSYAILPGGKGANQALAARRAGAPVAFVGAVGRDGFAALALQNLEAEGVDLRAVERVDAPTGAAFIAIDAHGQNAIVVASGANARLRAQALAARPMGPGDWLVLQREVADAESARATELARRSGAKVLLNLAPAGAIEEAYLRCLDLLVMNETEAADLAEYLGLGVTEPHAIARAIDARYAVATVVTLGAAGVVACAHGRTTEVPALAVDVVDTTGAGDTFVGALAASLHAGMTLPAALQRAVIAASLACRRDGAQAGAPTSLEIDAASARQSDSVAAQTTL